ncbi:MAG: peptidyl-prolyl cis-trans isomerase [Pseudonocardiales bacterium]|nr:peptidyl-prolyl cis-trans isomerase [Pseudonocardiales bacterium]
MVMESVWEMRPTDGGTHKMTYGGYGSGQADPFGPDPLGGPPSTPGYTPPITHASTGPGFPPPNFPPAGTPQGEANTLATLSIVFAFVFAPAGAALGHVALAQIRQSGERGRERALIGLTLSYVIIVLALIALVLWLVTGSGSESSPSVTTSTTATNTTTRAALPPPRTTVITPPPQQRPTVGVEDLRVGDCVEVQQNQPDPTSGPDTNIINIFPVLCQVRDGVFRVDQILSTSSCPGQTLFSRRETVFACISNYRG